MCIICLEYQRTKDLNDALRMMQAAYREPGSIEKEHLKKVTINLVRDFIKKDSDNTIGEALNETKRTHNFD